MYMCIYVWYVCMYICMLCMYVLYRMYACMYVSYVCIIGMEHSHTDFYLQFSFSLSRMEQLEQCDSSPFVIRL